MAEPIETSSPVPLPGTPFLALYAANRWRTLVRQNAAQAQRRELLKLVRAAERTRFGRDHRFHSIGDVAAYHKRVPLRTYGQHWDEYWRDAFPRLVDCTWPGTMPYFAVSSGTLTGKVEYIPCSLEMVASNKKAALDIFVHHLRNRPKTRVFDGKSFVLGGSTDLKEQAPGIYSGDISGITARNVPWWFRRWYFTTCAGLWSYVLGDVVRFVDRSPPRLIIPAASFRSAVRLVIRLRSGRSGDIAGSRAAAGKHGSPIPRCPTSSGEAARGHP